MVHVSYFGVVIEGPLEVTWGLAAFRATATSVSVPPGYSDDRCARPFKSTLGTLKH